MNQPDAQLSAAGTLSNTPPASASQASFLNLKKIVSSESDKDIKLTFSMHANSWTNRCIPGGGEQMPLWVWVQLPRDLLSRSTELTDEHLAFPHSESARASQSDVQAALGGALRELRDSAKQNMESSFWTWEPKITVTRGRWTVSKVGELNRVFGGTALGADSMMQFPTAECKFELLYHGDDYPSSPSPSAAGASQPPSSDDSHASEVPLDAVRKGDKIRSGVGDQTEREPSLTASTDEAPRDQC